MPQITFEGDWDDRAISQITALIKSIDLDGSGLTDLTPPAIASDLPKLLSARQRKLLQLWQDAGTAAIEGEPEPDEPDDSPDWADYQLQKAAIGALRIDPKTGKQYQLNRNRRWQNLGGSATIPGNRPAPSNNSVGMGSIGNFQFPPIVGEFGRGVYFPVLDAPGGNIRLRLRLNLKPDEIINEDEFNELEADLTSNLDLILDAKNVKAIQRSSGDRTVMLCVRHESDITPLGIVGGSGAIPDIVTSFGIVAINPFADYWIVDVEMLGTAQPLTKSLPSETHLDGARLIGDGATIDRVLVRDAIESCRSLGVSFDDVAVSILPGVPDFLPSSTIAFAMPQDNAVYLCPHDPIAVVQALVQFLYDRLNAGVQAGAVDPIDAMRIIAIAATLTPVAWLRMQILRYVGIVRAERSCRILSGDLSPDWARYFERLSGRGVDFWGNRRTIAYCMGEDYRQSIDPDGLPNLVTLEWDLTVPAIARMSQQVLMELVSP